MDYFNCSDNKIKALNWLYRISSIKYAVMKFYQSGDNIKYVTLTNTKNEQHPQNQVSWVKNLFGWNCRIEISFRFR